MENCVFSKRDTSQKSFINFKELNIALTRSVDICKLIVENFRLFFFYTRYTSQSL